MRVVELRAENIKRLKAVEITPDETMQVVAGRNAQGKSSVLDAIWMALGGGRASRGVQRPIRDGQDHASVTLDLGDLKVTRTWTPKGSSLRVESADGARYPSPQAVLDRLVGAMSFDPLAFTRLPAREQRDALLGLVDLDVDLDALEAERATLYDQRTQVGRQGRALGEVSVDETLPTEETPVHQLVDELHQAQEHNARVEQLHRDYLSACHKEEAAQARVDELRRQLDDARAALSDAALERERADEAATAAEEPVDTAVIEERMRTVEADNARIRANNAARERAAELEGLRGQYEDLTRRISDIDEAKAQALGEASFPVDGLGFDTDGVTYQGVPFSQASSAEQIRVSVAMAMALNPRLRVLRIMDGSLLDAEAMAAIRGQVAEKGFQLWIERVGDSDEGAVIIEDGQVASAAAGEEAAL